MHEVESVNKFVYGNAIMHRINNTYIEAAINIHCVYKEILEEIVQ